MRRGGGSRRKSKDQSEMEEKKKKDKRGHTKRTRRKRWELPQMGVLNSIPSIGYLQDIGRGGGVRTRNIIPPKEIDSEIWTGGVNTVRGIIMRTLRYNRVGWGRYENRSYVSSFIIVPTITQLGVI